MNLTDIIKEIYYDNKKTIRLYLGFFLVLSICLCGTGVFAQDISSLETSNVGGAFTNGLNSALVFLFPEIEPCMGFGITAVLAILGDYGMLPGGMAGADFGLLGYSWVFRIVILIWCVLSILPRYFGVTRIGGLCIERINDKYVGAVVIVLNLFPSLFQYTPSESAMASGVQQMYGASLSGASGIAYTLATFLGLCLMLVTYYVIRLFLMFIDILIMPVNCLVPGTSLIVETVKLIFTAFMAVSSVLSPVVFLVFYLIILVLSLIFFKKAYRAVRYFKDVYMLPMWHGITGKNTVCSLVPEKLPAKVRKTLENRQYRAVIPVYAIKTNPAVKQLEKYDLLWMIVGTGYNVTVCKPYKDSVFEMPMLNTFEHKMFINSSLMNIEMFGVYTEQGLGGRVKNNQKCYRYVISKDYMPLYEELKMQTGFVDYSQYISTVNPGADKWGAFRKMF